MNKYIIALLVATGIVAAALPALTLASQSTEFIKTEQPASSTIGLHLRNLTSPSNVFQDKTVNASSRDEVVVGWNNPDVKGCKIHKVNKALRSRSYAGTDAKSGFVISLRKKDGVSRVYSISVRCKLAGKTISDKVLINYSGQNNATAGVSPVTVVSNKRNSVAVLETTMGKISIELYEDTMPITASNFKKLAQGQFYNGIKFHRVIKDFMIQGGDPLTKDNAQRSRWGTGGPGYAITDEHVVGERLSNTRGSIAMANSGPNSGGSQFFINVVDNTGLDFDKQPFSSKHPVFGRVVDGMGVVDAIVGATTNQRDQPVEDIVIKSVTFSK